MNKKGFSLIELLMVIAILAILSSGVVIWFLGYQREAELGSTAKTIVNTLRDAQSRSINGKDFKSWGVYFDNLNNKFVLFRNDGGGFAGATVKEENYLSSFVKISTICQTEAARGVCLNGDGKEIIFNLPKGDTGQYGTFNGNNTAIRIELASSGDVFKDIIVTPLGKINWQ